MKTEIINQDGRYQLVQYGQVIIEADTLFGLLEKRNEQMGTGLSLKQLRMMAQTLERFYQFQ